MKVQGTRTFLELRVGAHHSVEVVLYLRQEDIEWFNQNSDNNTEVENDKEVDHYREVLTLLSDEIVPRMCYKEMEAFYGQKYRHKFPPALDMIGMKNTAAAALQTAAAMATTTTLNPKRRRGTTTSHANKKKPKLTKKQQQELQTQKRLLGDPKDKDVYYAFGDTLQLAYRMEDVDVYQSATLLYNSKKSTDDETKKKKKKNNDHDDSKAGSGGFQALTKLSKRFLLWCYKLDSQDPTAPDPPRGGFVRPEMIPMAHLFRGGAAAEAEAEKEEDG